MITNRLASHSFILSFIHGWTAETVKVKAHKLQRSNTPELLSLAGKANGIEGRRGGGRLKAKANAANALRRAGPIMEGFRAQTR